MYKGGKTPYFYEVADWFASAVGEGYSDFWIPACADAMGRKYTRHFRRAVGQLEQDGVLQTYKAYSENGGLLLMARVTEDARERMGLQDA